MKKLLIALILIPILGISQTADWHPFPEGQTALFSIKQEENSDYLYQAVVPVKIDSIIQEREAEIYYNTRTPVSLYVDDDWFYYYDPMQSWLGYSTTIQDGIAIFQNIYDQSIYVNFEQDGNEPWLFYTFDDGSYIEAHVSEKSEMEIVEGLIDSVKYISFESYDSKHKLISSNKYDQIILSKNYGFVETYMFAKFPLNRIRKVFSIENEENHFGFNYNINGLMASYEVGDTIHLLYHADDFIQYIITDKIETEELVSYKYILCDENDVISEKNDTYYINRLPYQSIINDQAIGFYTTGLLKDKWNNKDEYTIQFLTYQSEEVYNGVDVWVYDRFPGNNGESPNMFKVNDVFTFSYFSKYHNKSELLYYHNSDEYWGEPWQFDCNLGFNENLNKEFVVKPNPSEGVVSIECEDIISNLSVVNFKGQIVKQINKLNQDNLDLSDLENGVYIIEITTQNQQINRQKVIINK